MQVKMAYEFRSIIEKETGLRLTDYVAEIPPLINAAAATASLPSSLLQETLFVFYLVLVQQVKRNKAIYSLTMALFLPVIEGKLDTRGNILIPNYYYCDTII